MTGNRSSMVQACSERAQALEVQVPKLRADATKAEQDMAAAQQQSEDAEITDEAREALLERIQRLTVSESEVKKSLADAEQVRAYTAQVTVNCRMFDRRTVLTGRVLLVC